MSIYLVIAVIAYVVYHYLTRTLTYWHHRNVMGPKPIPFFGNYKEVALRRKSKFALYNEIYKQYPKEKVVGMYHMITPTLLIRDLDIVKQILIKDFEKFPDRGIHYSKKGLGENIVHCDGDTWKDLRNLFSVLFTTSKIKHIVHLLDKSGDKCVNYIKKNILTNPEQDAFKVAFKYGVSTTMATTYGWDIDTFHENSDWYNILDENFINTYWEEIDMLLPGILTKFNLSVTTKETRKICHKILKTCLSQQSTYFDTKILNVKNTLLNLKLKNQTFELKDIDNNFSLEITDDLLAGQFWVFHMAGYISNTLAMTFALYHLARNQTIQEKLRNEVDEAMKKCGGKLTYELLKEMNYLKMVFEETLRMHPSSPMISRNVTHKVKLDGTDLVLDKGLTVTISPYAIQHDEKYYPEPEKFDPERFSSDNAKNQHPCSFLSFGAGPRGCLATQYARVQFGVGLAKLLHHFRVETTNNTYTYSRITYDPYHILIKPKPAVQLKFVLREK